MMPGQWASRIEYFEPEFDDSDRFGADGGLNHGSLFLLLESDLATSYVGSKSYSPVKD